MGWERKEGVSSMSLKLEGVDCREYGCGLGGGLKVFRGELKSLSLSLEDDEELRVDRFEAMLEAALILCCVCEEAGGGGLCSGGDLGFGLAGGRSSSELDSDMVRTFCLVT